MASKSRHPHLNPRRSSAAELWAERLVVQRVREMDPLERLERMEDLNHAAREIAFAGLRERYPDAEQHELELREAALRLGRETMVRFFDWDPVARGW
jgi:hypothetical protein